MGKISFNKSNNVNQSITPIDPVVVYEYKTSEPEIIYKEKIVEIPVEVEKIIEKQVYINAESDNSELYNLIQKFQTEQEQIKLDYKKCSQDLILNKELVEVRHQELNDLCEELLSSQNEIKESVVYINNDKDEVFVQHKNAIETLAKKLEKQNNLNKIYLLIVGALTILNFFL